MLEFKDFSSQVDSTTGSIDSNGAGDDVSAAGVDDSNVLSFCARFMNAVNPLDCDVVVVDEASMLDAPLCAALFMRSHRKRS